MANEGEFLKGDGDILFASEVNDFNKNRILGSGTFTSDGSGNIQDVGNFSITEDLAEGIINIDIIATRSSGASDLNELSLDNNSGNHIAPWTIINTSGGQITLRLSVRKNPKTTTSVNALKFVNGSSSDINENSEFNVSAAETFFINFTDRADGPTIWKISWVATITEV